MKGACEAPPGQQTHVRPSCCITRNGECRLKAHLKKLHEQDAEQLHQSIAEPHAPEQRVRLISTQNRCRAERQQNMDQLQADGYRISLYRILGNRRGIISPYQSWDGGEWPVYDIASHIGHSHSKSVHLRHFSNQASWRWLSGDNRVCRHHTLHMFPYRYMLYSFCAWGNRGMLKKRHLPVSK